MIRRVDMLLICRKLRLVSFAVLLPWFAVAAGDDWVRGIGGDMKDATSAFDRLELLLVAKHNGRLTGTCAFDNHSPNNSGSRPVVLNGVMSDDGRFWPTVTLEVSNATSGPWKQLSAPQQSGTVATVTVEPNSAAANLSVPLDAFESEAAYRFGRILLPSGDSAIFELSYLCPPR